MEVAEYETVNVSVRERKMELCERRSIIEDTYFKLHRCLREKLIPPFLHQFQAITTLCYVILLSMITEKELIGAMYNYCKTEYVPSHPQTPLIINVL